MTAAKHRPRVFDAQLGDVDATTKRAVVRLSMFEIFELAASAGDTLLIETADEMIAARVVSVAGARVNVELLADPSPEMRRVRVRKSTIAAGAGKASR